MQTSQKTPTPDLIHVQEREIMKHKWIESQKAGRDIGDEQARQDWLAKHFPNWKRHQWQQALAETLGLSLN